MRFKPKKRIPQFADLKIVLAQSKETDNALYQTVQEIIERLTQFQFIINEDIEANAGGGGVDPTLRFATKFATYLTLNDEIALLPNSFQVLAGTNITLDSTVPNKLTINSTATGGGAGIDEVHIGPDQPANTFELWYDVDEVVTVVPPIQSGSIAQQPTGLGPGDAGLLYQVLAPYYHTVRWNGSAWEFVPGDCGNGYFSERPFPPQDGGWAPCNGSSTDYLLLGPTLQAASFNTPNLTTGVYLKGFNAYDGLINPATGGSASSAGAGLTGIDGPTTTNVGGPTITDVGGPVITDVGGPIGTGVAGATSGTTGIAGATSGLTGVAGGHSHGGGTLEGGEHTHTGWTSEDPGHQHLVPQIDTLQGGGSVGADNENDVQVSYANHVHTVPAQWSDNNGVHGHNIQTDTAGSRHWHGIQGEGDHQHSVSIPDHAHTMAIGDHAHSIAQHQHGLAQHQHTLAQHLHTIAQHQHTIPDHVHSVSPTEPANLKVLVYFRR